ncbi:DUF4262 domain-containing protein [Burkholderiaceae bacterium DAT-1]|nr:DUF4262 domain-containing protein [Burkholderiaceae bacterium DAT-1]
MVRTTATDASEQKVLDDVKNYGWHVVGILEDEQGPPYNFSVGFCETLNHPEVVIVGLPNATAHHLINDIGELIRAGGKFEHGSISSEIINNYDCQFIEIAPENKRAYLGYACWYNEGDIFPALQCVWPSKLEKFPWDPDANSEFKELQFLLGDPA